jgi:poly(3-hydroxybutyrate) depolymerase
MRANTKVFLVSLALLLICSIVNWGVITGWGNIKIRRLTMIGDNTLTYSALMYTPKNATDKSPAPGIITFHGNSGNARNHESWAVEFARRGFVVMAIDNLGAGSAEYERKLGGYAAPEYWTEYLLNCSFVDPARIVISGHSQGADVSKSLGLKYQSAVCMISNGGNTPGITSEVGGAYHGNMLYVNGLADDRNPVNNYRAGTMAQFRANGTLGEDEELVPNQVYGSFEDGNANMLAEIPDQVHETAFTNRDHIAVLLDFSQNAIEVPNYIDSTDQIWPIKDAVGLSGMFTFAAFLMCFAMFLIDQAPAFAAVKQPIPRNGGLRGPGLAISIVATIGFPLIALWSGSFGLVQLLGTTTANTALFRVRFTTIALATIVALSFFGLLMFFLYWLTAGKEQKMTIRDLGLTSEGRTGLDWKLILKSFGLAMIVVVIGWTYLAVQESVLGTDFYCLFFGYKPIPANKFQYYIPYIIVWILSFIVAAVGMNVERRLPSTSSDALDTAIAVIFNGLLGTAGITGAIILQNYLQVHVFGSSATALGNWGTGITRLWGLPVGMFIGCAGNTYCYRKTGNIWLGAFLMGIVCALGACLYGQVQF